VTGDDGQTIYAIGLAYKSGGLTNYGSDTNIETDQVPKLWKSADGGITWADKTSKVTGASNLPDVGVVDPSDDDFVFFSAVAAAPDDPDFVVVAGYDGKGQAVVVGSDDGAGKFHYMGCSACTGEILCMDVSIDVDGTRQIAVGTMPSTTAGVLTPGGVGDVWRYEWGSSWASYWVNTTTGLDKYATWTPVHAVTSVAFSPNYDIDDTILAMGIADIADPALVGNNYFGAGNDKYPGFILQAGTWDSLDYWNGDAEFDNYPVTIENESDIIVADIYNSISANALFQYSSMLRQVSDLALPYDYSGEDSGDRTMMLVVNGVEFNPATTDGTYGSRIDEGGFAYILENTSLSCEMLDHEDNPWISSIAYYGSIDMEGKAMVGLAFPNGFTLIDLGNVFFSGSYSKFVCCTGIQVLRSEAIDVCCPDWDAAQKPPTGQFNATVAFTPDGDMAYASSEGLGVFQKTAYYADESAFSISTNDGDCWNQTGLIDTMIDNLVDVAVNAACGYVYIVSVNDKSKDSSRVCGCDSVWRSEDDGATYMRVWCKELKGTDEIGVLGLAPEEEDEVETIYMADRGTETVYYADDSGLCKWLGRNTGLDHITDIAVLDESTVYALDFDASTGVAKSTTHARHWSSAEDADIVDGHTIVAQGDWVLVGGADGDVSYSDDGGDSFSELDAPSASSDDVHVAFDSYFEDNGYVYAAVDGADRGIYRTTIDDADFDDMDACAYNYTGIVLSNPDGNPKTSASTGGVLYASYNGTGLSTAFPESGVARILNPASELCCGGLSWDYLYAKLGSSVNFSTQPSDLAICGCLTADSNAFLTADSNAFLWAIDLAQYYAGFNWTDYEFPTSGQGRLWIYEDCLAKAGPDLIGVEDGATVASDPCDCWNTEFALEWERQCKVCEYEIQIALDDGFKHVAYDTSDFKNTAHAGLTNCVGTVEYYKPSKPASPSLVIDTGMLECSTEYFWRIRSHYTETDEIIRSQWSDTWSFTVAAGPTGAIKLTSPDDGATNLPLEGLVFTWTAVQGATGYDFALMDASGASIESKTGLTGTSYVYAGKLGYDTSYTWQVKAMKNGNALSESAVSTFRAMSEPVAPPEIPETVINFPEPAGTPSWVWVVIGLGAVLVITVIVLIFRTRRV